MADFEIAAPESVSAFSMEKNDVLRLHILSNSATTEVAVIDSTTDVCGDTEVILAGSKRKSDASASEEGDGFEYPKKASLAAITLALCLSVFCISLDNTIIATAIPCITNQFKDLNDVGWYGSSYLLTICTTQLIYGKFYTYYSIKWVYLVALFVFELGSLISGLARNSVILIIGRAIAGLGAAGIFSGAILIIGKTVPLRQRPAYMELIGGMYGISSVAGPLLGGVFTDHLTWRWCFFINLPLGAITSAFIVFFFEIADRSARTEDTWRQRLNKFDIHGTSLFMPAIICLLLALQWGGSKYMWDNTRIIGLFVAFAIMIIGFVIVQWWKQEDAMIPPRIVLDRNVAGCAWFGAMLGAAFFVLVYYLPIWFQVIKGASATKSGVMNLPAILGLVVSSIVSGGLVTVLGYYTPFMLISSTLMAIGAGLMTTLTADSSSACWIGYQFLFGAGVGSGMQQTLIAIQVVLPVGDIPIGTAIMMFTQTLGGALFIAVGQNVFANQLRKNLHLAVPDLDIGLVLRTGVTELKNTIQPSHITGVLSAYNESLTQTFYVSLATASLSIAGAVFVQWKSMKGRRIIMAAA